MNHKFPIKRFGQNYLRDENIIGKIISEISPKCNDLIIEIGPGEGAITSKLIEKADNLIAIEIDNNMPLVIFHSSCLGCILKHIHTAKGNLKLPRLLTFQLPFS